MSMSDYGSEAYGDAGPNWDSEQSKSSFHICENTGAAPSYNSSQSALPRTKVIVETTMPIRQLAQVDLHVTPRDDAARGRSLGNDDTNPRGRRICTTPRGGANVSTKNTSEYVVPINQMTPKEKEQKR